MQAADLLLKDLQMLRQTLAVLAKRHAKTLMMGRSHGIHGEPITFGVKVAGWFTEMGRGADRLKQARAVIAYGTLSGAMGTFAHVDTTVERYVCQKLGLEGEPVATQIVPRDRHAE